jgi:hypothetical protein
MKITSYNHHAKAPSFPRSLSPQTKTTPVDRAFALIQSLFTSAHPHRLTATALLAALEVGLLLSAAGVVAVAVAPADTLLYLAPMARQTSPRMEEAAVAREVAVPALAEPGVLAIWWR